MIGATSLVKVTSTGRSTPAADNGYVLATVSAIREPTNFTGVHVIFVIAFSNPFEPQRPPQATTDRLYWDTP